MSLTGYWVTVNGSSLFILFFSPTFFFFAPYSLFSRLCSCVGSPPVISPSFQCTFYPGYDVASFVSALPTLHLHTLIPCFCGSGSVILLRVYDIVGELHACTITLIYIPPFASPSCTITLTFSVENGKYDFENGHQKR